MAKLTLFKRDDGDLYEAIEGTVAYKILSSDSRFVIVQGDDHDGDTQQTESDEQSANSRFVIVQGDDHDGDTQQTESDEQSAKSKRVSKK